VVNFFLIKHEEPGTFFKAVKRFLSPWDGVAIYPLSHVLFAIVNAWVNYKVILIFE
jgi:hypothetical protein